MRITSAVQWPLGWLGILVVSSAILTGALILSSSPGDVIIALIACLVIAAAVYAGRIYSPRLVIFGTFLALLYAGSRDFAYLAIDIGQARLFIAELVLIGMWVSLVPQLIRHAPWPRTPLPVALFAYLGVGAIELIRCLPAYGLDAVRDSALCYYSLAFLLTLFLTPDQDRVRTLLWFCWAGWVAAGLVVVAKYFGGLGVRLDYDLMRYGAGAQALACISSVGWAIASSSPGVTRRRRLVLWLAGIAHLFVGIFLIQHRSLFVATVGVGVTVAYLCLSKRWMRLTSVGAIAFAFLLLLSLIPWNPGLLPTAVSDTLARIESIIGHEDANASWRLEIWKRAILFGTEHPLTGAGFGKSMGDALAFGETDRVDPHNSYVAIFFRMGLPGILAFGTLWLQVIGTALARARSGTVDKALLGMAMSAHMASAIFAFFNVVLEGPYMGIPFWVSLALVHQAAQPSTSKVPEELRDVDGDRRMSWAST